ncbi:hypothetical protein ACFTAO_16955 [Paenibacillus rhizoplanae]
MNIEFSKVSLFERGTLLELLKDAYSFDRRYEQSCLEDWQEFDNFFSLTICKLRINMGS